MDKFPPLKQAIYNSGFTVKAFAKDANIGYSTLNKICNGFLLPGNSSIKKLAQALNISPNEVVKLIDWEVK